MSPAHKMLEAAAAPTLDRIHRDRQKAPSQLKPLLAYLETHLFDSDLDANQLKRACGVRDNSLPIYFHHALSLPPYAYIEDCRLEVACRLLRDTDLKVWQIAQLLGYSTLQVFSRAFDRWSGLRPSVFRRQAKAEVQVAGNDALRGEDEAAAGEDSLIDLTQLRKAVNGALEEDEATRLALRLAKMYPESFSQVAQSRTGADTAAAADGVVRFDAEQAWALLESRPREEQVSLVQGRCQLASVELVHMLVTRGIEETRRDPQRGIEIVTLAVDCLEVLSGSLEEDKLLELEVKAHSWLANAYRVAFDLTAAERSLQRAYDALRPTCSADVRSELTLIHSGLRMTQRRLKESLKMADDTISLLSTVQNPKLHMRARLHRAQIHYLMNQVPRAIADLWYAHDLKDQVADRFLHASLYQNLSLNLALEGQHLEASCYLPIARSVCEELGLERAGTTVDYIEGLVARDLGNLELAEPLLYSARSRFYEQDQGYLGALAALDLAILCALEARFSECTELACEAIEVFEGLNIRYQALEAIQLLRKTIGTKQVASQTLHEIRSAIARCRAPLP